MLLVEDSRTDQARFRRALERDSEADWALTLKESAEEALDWLGQGGLTDLVVVDLRLPGMDGLTLLRTLRQRLGGPSPAVVLLTGSGGERIAVEAMKAGAQDYLVKDELSPERLGHGLRGAVESVHMALELEASRQQLIRAERTAREALAVREELLSLATHDLKGPLQLIHLNAQVLFKSLPEPVLLRGAKARLGEIQRAVWRLNELIDHFLESTRGEEGELVRELMDLRLLVEDKVRELAPAEATHPVRLEVEGSDFTGEWDGAALERVLDNLLGNALKYSPQGGAITVRLREKPSGWVELRVSDQGVGIPPEELPFVFERFRRGSNVASNIPGSGVGLASARRWVELHGGRISAWSERGQGSRFTVRLPRLLVTRA